MTMGKRPPLDEWLSLFQSTIAAEGITTGPGAAAGTSIVDAGLIGAGANSFFSMLMVLYPGQPLMVDSQDITAFNTLTGEVTFAGAYKGVAAAIPAGVPYKIVTFRFVPAEVAAIKTQTDKLAGAAPSVGTATENWNAAEANVVSIGANDTRNKLHSLVVDVSALTAAATISIRMYMQVNGVEKKVYDQDFIVGTDPDGLWIVNGTVGIHEVLRVTAQSDNIGDNGRTIAYDYMTEAM